jgi:hypothetical protein
MYSIALLTAANIEPRSQVNIASVPISVEAIPVVLRPSHNTGTGNHVSRPRPRRPRARHMPHVRAKLQMIVCSLHDALLLQAFSGLVIEGEFRKI